MKKLILVSLIIAAAVAYSAPVENVISFQGKIIVDGTPFSGTRNIEFKIYNVASGGAALWAENHLGVAVTGGLFNVELGGTTPMTSLDFDQQYWVGISVGGGAELSPRYKLTSSPYSMADGDWTIDGTDMYSGVTGNVGIGTTTPGSGFTTKFDVVGRTSLRTNSSDVNKALVLDVTGTSHRIYTDASSGTPYDLILGTYPNGHLNQLVLRQSNGYVGIGTSTPSYQLDVVTDGQVGIKSTSSNASFSSIYVSATAGTAKPGYGYVRGSLKAHSYVDASENWILKVGSTENALAVTHDGFVGIGTADPSGQLTINDNITSLYPMVPGIVIGNPTGGTAAMWIGKNSGNYLQIGWIDPLYGRISCSSTMPLILQEYGGNVGIGTTSPDDPLHVEHTVISHSSSNSPTIKAEVTDGVYTMTGILAGENGYQGTYAATDKPGGYGVKSYSTGGNCRGVYAVAIGSGTTNYGVYGSAFDATYNYGVYCEGDGAYTGTWTDVSDRKFKKNITPMSGILAKVLDLNPVTYEMRADEFDFMGFSEGTEYGLIAQELKEVFPELVHHGVFPGEQDGSRDPVEYEGIDYISLTSILVRAVQEQQAQIEGLETENAELRARIERLERLIETK